jgi:hypothetical protein
MADAPAAGGGGGWGALEVILALVLAVGLITTLTGGKITPLFGPATTSNTATSTSGTKTSGCTIIVDSPKTKAKIDTSVSVSGSFPSCIASSVVPDTINAQVVDSTGASLSVYTSIPVSKGLFGVGAATFNANIPLVGTAHSTTGYLILVTPARTDGSSYTARVAIQFVPGSTINAYNNGQPTFVPSQNYLPNGTTSYGTTTTNTNTTTTNYATGQSFVPSTYSSNTYTTPTTTNNNTTTYTPPTNTTPSGDTGTNTGNTSGGSGTTF